MIINNIIIIIFINNIIIIINNIIIIIIIIIINNNNLSVTRQHMKHRLLYNQSRRPLVVRRENAALTHEA